MDIITGQYVIKYSTYTEMGETDGYRYNFRVYGGHTNVVQLILGILPVPPGVSVGCTGTPTLPPAGCAVIPWVCSVGSEAHHSSFDDD